MGKDKKEKSSESSESSDAFDDSSEDKSETSKNKTKSDIKIDENKQHIYYRKYVAKNGDVINYEVGRYKPTGVPRGQRQTPLSKVKRLVSLLNEEKLEKVQKYIDKLNNTN